MKCAIPLRDQVEERAWECHYWAACNGSLGMVVISQVSLSQNAQGGGVRIGGFTATGLSRWGPLPVRGPR